jgi:membrane associated rhomboid family serine protease
MTSTPVGMRCPECANQRTRVVTARSLSRAPTLTYALIAVNVAVYLAGIAMEARAAGGLGGNPLIEHGALSRATVADGEYWRLVTSGFLHAGLLHIGFNMLSLYIIGMILEPAIGRLRFGLIYLVSLVAGSFGALLLTPVGFTVGASGAVYGVAGAAILVMRRRGMDPMQSGLLLWLGINLVVTFTVPGISIGGHLGGLAGGALATLALFGVGERRGVPKLVPELLMLALGAVAVFGSIAVAGSGA